MEIFIVIIGVVAILIAISSQKNRMLERMDDLESEMQKLRKILSKPETQTQTQAENKPKESYFVKVQESTDHEIYMPSHIHEEEKVILKEEEFTAPVVEEPIVQEEFTAPVIEKPVIQEENIFYFPQIKPEKPVDEPIKNEPIAPKEKRDFEKFIGENLLSKIGITTLVLGIAYFVKYAIDQNWINEIGRVAIGIFVGGAVIGIAHKLKNSYRTFSSILVGGGISILYITITIAFREYQLLPQSVAFVFLIIITAFSVFLSILYDRKELAIFSLLGGFASPLMISTGVGNYIVLFSYILILNSGMLVLSLKKQWKIVGLISYILTQFFFWIWIWDDYRNEKFGAATFIFLFFVQFYLLALINHYKNERKITPFQAFIILSNNLSLFAAAILIFNNNKPNIDGLISIIIAVLNAIPMIVLFRDSTVDKRLIYLLLAVVLTFVSLAIPIQLNGCAITMFWAVETVILLWLWQKSEIKIFKYSFIAVELLVLISLLMDWTHFYAENAQTLSIIFNKPFITGFMITATVWVNAFLFKREESKVFFPEIINLKMSRIFSFAGIILLFFTLFWELQYQMEEYYKNENFCLIIYGLYFYTFLSVLTVTQWKKENWQKLLYGVLTVCSVLYVVSYLVVVYRFRESILGGLGYWEHFAVHYLTLPSIILFFVFMLKNKNILNKKYQSFFYWFIAVISVIVLSVETDNLLLMTFFTSTNKYKLLTLSHNIIYPILWGIASLILMLTGMKQKNRTLRIISLSLFALIIAKLYLHDVWEMEQTGRIIAFIFLGVVLLLVSFLYQKLKVLLMKEEKIVSGEN